MSVGFSRIRGDTDFYTATKEPSYSVEIKRRQEVRELLNDLDKLKDFKNFHYYRNTVPSILNLKEAFEVYHETENCGSTFSAVSADGQGSTEQPNVIWKTFQNALNKDRHGEIQQTIRAMKTRIEEHNSWVTSSLFTRTWRYIRGYKAPSSLSAEEIRCFETLKKVTEFLKRYHPTDQREKAKKLSTSLKGAISLSYYSESQPWIFNLAEALKVYGETGDCKSSFSAIPTSDQDSELSNVVYQTFQNALDRKGDIQKTMRTIEARVQEHDIWVASSLFTRAWDYITGYKGPLHPSSTEVDTLKVLKKTEKFLNRNRDLLSAR